MKKLIVANWKMNPRSLEEAKMIVKEIGKSVSMKTIVVLCPPSIFLGGLIGKSVPKNFYWGVQNVFYKDKGAFTGEISVAMAKGVGATYAIIGHSERRALGENDDLVAKKVKAARDGGLVPIVCVGESLRDKEGLYLNTLKTQLVVALALMPKSSIKEVVIAYEPLWAIGKDEDEAETPHDIHQVALFIRKVLVDTYGAQGKETAIIYGGAVGDANAYSIIKEGMVDGILVGHKSLESEEFLNIIKEVARV